MNYDLKRNNFFSFLLQASVHIEESYLTITNKFKCLTFPFQLFEKANLVKAHSIEMTR